MSVTDRLHHHPFAVLAHLDRVVAVSFAFPVEVLRPLVPAPLEIDAHEGLGFLTVALAWTRRLRPAGLPEWLGRDFLLAGYRIFTRLRNDDGRRLRGLRILRSETDRRGMVWLGNLFTHYRYRRVKVQLDRDGTRTRVRTALPDGTPTLDLTYDDAPDASLPVGSPFPDWRSARRFAGPMPFTFSPQADGSCVVVEGPRDDWTPRPVRVPAWQVGLFDEPPLHGEKPVLANAFAVENIAYRWEKGRVVRPQNSP